MSVMARYFVFLLTTFLTCYSSTYTQHIAANRVYVNRILDSLEAAIRFFDKEHMFVNLDAVSAGTRFVEAQTKVLYNNLLRRGSTDWYTLRRIQQLSNLGRIASEKAIPYLIRDSPQYYRSYQPILQSGFWEFDAAYKNLPPTSRIWVHSGSRDHLMDGTTDNCIGELLGTGSQPRCGITPTCWGNMTASGNHGYSLSHQQVYLTIGELCYCHNAMERMRILHRQPTVSYTSAEMCANMLTEAHDIAQNGYQVHRRDLFMEILEFCGMIGIRETFNREWLDRMLSWQNPVHGCYTDIPHFSTLVRKKRAEKRHRNGCLSHMTAVAVGALTQYLKFLLLTA